MRPPLFTYAVVPIILLVVAALVWTWWTSRQDRDPASSVDSFTRALTAMRPGESPVEGPERASVPGTDTSGGTVAADDTPDGSDD